MHTLLPSSFLAFFLLFLLPYLAFSDYFYQICGTTGNYTSNSVYQANLNQLFSSLSTQTSISSGFGNVTIGTSPNRVSGLSQCRGDVNFTACESCINQSFQDILKLCPNNKEAIIWYDDCFLHYSNKDILLSYVNSIEIIAWNVENVTFQGWDASNESVKSSFNFLVNSLLTGVSDWAANNSSKRFGTGKMSIPISPVIYGLTQCTPDMSADICLNCLQNLTSQMLQWFDGRKGGRILGERCSMRYETYPFFNGEPNFSSVSKGQVAASPPTTSTSSSPSPSGGKKGGSGKISIIAGSIAGVLLLVGCSIFFIWITNSTHKDNEDSQELGMLGSSNEIRDIWRNEESSPDFSQFSFSQIESATNHFNLVNKLGRGGFGPVYKGVLPNGLQVAVKRLSTHSGQGLLEFKNEIQLIAKLQHRNLVRLVGWCVQGEEKLLVYEFMPNKSLDFFIFDETRGKLLNWEKRFQIIEGIAQGLLYLHKHSRLRIIHRDLKASNILLDSDMTPKISDFGLARIFGANELQANTNHVVGTYGYMAPEYASEGLFSVKSDVFSYGVMLLEIVSGKRNMGFHRHGDFLNLLGFAWEQWKEGRWVELIDSSLTEESNKEIERCIHVALLCTQENPIDRPTMSGVMSFLTSENIILPEPKQPAYFNVRIAERAVASSDFDGSTSSINEMSITKQQGR